MLPLPPAGGGGVGRLQRRISTVAALLRPPGSRAFRRHPTADLQGVVAQISPPQSGVIQVEIRRTEGPGLRWARHCMAVHSRIQRRFEVAVFAR